MKTYGEEYKREALELVIWCRTADSGEEGNEFGLEQLCNEFMLGTGFKINRRAIAKGCMNA